MVKINNLIDSASVVVDQIASGFEWKSAKFGEVTGRAITRIETPKTIRPPPSFSRKFVGQAGYIFTQSFSSIS